MGWGGGGFRQEGSFLWIAFYWNALWNWNFVTFSFYIWYNFFQKKIFEKIFHSAVTTPLLRAPKNEKKKWFFFLFFFVHFMFISISKVFWQQNNVVSLDICDQPWPRPSWPHPKCKNEIFLDFFFFSGLFVFLKCFHNKILFILVFIELWAIF